MSATTKKLIKQLIGEIATLDERNEMLEFSQEVSNETIARLVREKDGLMTAYCLDPLKKIKEPLLEARRLAMKNTMSARILECGDFGKIAQDLDYICGLLYGENNK